MATTVFGAIADDFTGATDLAAMLARAGMPVTLRVGIPDAAAAPASAYEVIALKIRTVPPEDAVAEARAALRWLRAKGAARIYWKYCSTFDSTPRGNIGPVADALMSDLRCDLAVHCPGFPENGRRVFMGNLFVGETPLDESPMRDHPLTPMRDADLCRLLAPQVGRPTGRVTWPVLRDGAEAVRAALARMSGHVVLDTIETADLATIAEAVHDRALICGGSALAQLLPGHLGRPGEAPAPLPVPPSGRVVLAGSCSAATRAQVGAYLDAGAQGYRLDPLELARGGGLAAARAWLAGRDPEADKILFATAPPAAVSAAQEALGAQRAGTLVEEALATLAQDAVRAGIGRIVVAGGETAGAVTKALGVRTLRIGPEIAAGVPWCMTEGGPALALKSGNFGGPGFFSDAFARLGENDPLAAE